MIKRIKKIALVGLALYILNKSFMPLGSLSYDPNINNPKIQRVMGTEEYQYIYRENDEQSSLKYLKLAHAITMKYMSLGHTSWGSSDDEELDSRMGNCTETSKFSYSNYLFLINSAGKSALCKYVRMADGTASLGEYGGGHRWLEIFRDGSWIPYETTLNDLPSSAKIEPKSIDELVSTESVLKPNGVNYNKTNTFQVNANGDVENNLDLLGIVQGEGFVYLLRKTIFSGE